MIKLTISLKCLEIKFVNIKLEIFYYFKFNIYNPTYLNLKKRYINLLFNLIKKLNY